MTLDDLKREVVKAGFTPSSGSWEDSEAIHAFSMESDHCLGHPDFEASYNKSTGWLRIGKRVFENKWLEAWKQEVASGETILSFNEWKAILVSEIRDME